MPERDSFVTDDDARKLRTLLVGTRARGTSGIASTSSSSTTNWIVRASSRRAKSQRTWSR